MEYIVLLEKKKGHYRAVVPALPDCVVEGQTREDTLSRMRQAIVDKLSKVEITKIEVGAVPPCQPVEIEPSMDPWAPFIGMWKDDATWDEFQMEIAKYRKQVDKEQGDA
ncbi:TPA: hypothetical protein EYP66_23820 [Candidatus Poribacteria bacterium]|nr:hypothetical protein [Candidatus Poribacteria bacterium]